jgi:hypothetical protein
MKTDHKANADLTIVPARPPVANAAIKYLDRYLSGEPLILDFAVRIFLFILGVFAAVVCFEKPAAARNNAWCAYLNFAGGGTNCGFSTFQQCLAAVSGDSSSSCGPNPQYHGVSGPAPSRRVRHHSKNFG